MHHLKLKFTGIFKVFTQYALICDFQKTKVSCLFSLRDNKIEDLTSIEVSIKFNPILILFAI
jgi:hypothetical protein